ncbi:hypothetical protein PDE_05725 [Penicillium oxalicum 114-2]|uniref:Uncharacterized protein n=1 Tax=Penicillium oxalicum (strain 114-2 / CGMCC 5302) TaxID=933388 RepID=S8AWU2_PENO1|nr:hypothetical protein PDE_05725 [Penicillium oxalicum 114-2]
MYFQPYGESSCLFGREFNNDLSFCIMSKKSNIPPDLNKSPASYSAIRSHVVSSSNSSGIFALWARKLNRYYYYMYSVLQRASVLDLMNHLGLSCPQYTVK